MSLKKGYTKIPNILMFDEGLSVPARLLYVQLLAVQFKHGKSFSSRETMGKWLDDKKPRAVSNYIKELKDRDLVEVKEVSGKTNEYRAKEIDVDIKPKETPANDCNTTPAMKCKHKNKKRSLRIINKEIYKESLNYPIAEQLVGRYIDGLPNLLSSRKSKVLRDRAIKHLTVRLDKGEDLERLERATECAIKEQAETEKQYIIGPCNFFSPNKKTGGKYQMFLKKETAAIFDNIQFGEVDA